MIRIAAVDDEKHVLERFEKLACEFDDIELCGLFETGEQLLSYLETHCLDAVFLDIEMPEVSGLEISHKLLNLNETINIVFLTAFNQYAVEAFEVEAIDYILKPLTEARLGKTLSRLQKKKTTIKQPVKPIIHCIGDYEVIVEKTLSWKNSKAKEVLAFLTQKGGRPANWEKIADAVWPEYNAQKAQTNFHATMYLLRKRLAEAGISKILVCGRGDYRIVPELVDCDLYLLEELLQMNEIKRKEDFSQLEYFKKKGYMEASGYAWAQPKAAELEEACNKALDRKNP